MMGCTKYSGLLIVLTFLVGCASLPTLPVPTEQQPATELLPQPVETVYAIGSQDVLRIDVYGEPDLSLRVVVSPDGSFSYPLLGQISASARTILQLQEEMQKGLSAYLVSPQVRISIEEVKSQQVLVMGEVKAPGTYPLSKVTTLLETLGKAGGPTVEASHIAIVLPASARAGNATETALRSHPDSIQVDIRRLFTGDLTLNVPIHAGDTIYVASAPSFYVLGEVARPGRYRLEPDTTVAKAISVAGGMSRFAGKTRMKVQRIVNGHREEFRASMMDILLAGDILIIPESVF